MNLVMSLATTRAPAGLADLRVTRADTENQSVSYRIGCPCGSEVGSFVSERRPSEFFPGEYFWADPLVFQCAACASSATFFDSRRDGYDAIFNACSASEQRTNDELVPCPSCSGERHRLLASYSYNFEDKEVEREWKAEERVQMPDAFDSAAFELTCVQCGETHWLAEFECA
jgi:hypothetical protein